MSVWRDLPQGNDNPQGVHAFIRGSLHLGWTEAMPVRRGIKDYSVCTRCGRWRQVSRSVARFIVEHGDRCCDCGGILGLEIDRPEHNPDGYRLEAVG